METLISSCFSRPPRTTPTRLRTLRILVLIPLVSVLASAAVDSGRLARIVETQTETGNFSGAVLVARGDTPLLDQAWGQANVEWDIANTPATRFRIGSISKQFAAAAILLLEERGKLKTSDRVTKFVPDAPATWAPLTLHHLLTHTSGLPNITSFPEFRSTWKWMPTTVAEMVSRFRDRPLVFAPGEKFAYSNSNYLLLGYIIEKLSGSDYATFLREQVLDPLGLHDTGLDSNAVILPRRASGYANSAGELQNAPYSEMSVPHAAGAMYSTTHDLHRWMRALFAGKLLSPASLAKMLTPEKDAYALGIRVTTQGGRNVVEHGGSIAGFSAQLNYYPDDQLTVVVLANRNTPAAKLLPRLLAKTALEPDAAMEPTAGSDKPEAPGNEQHEIAVPVATLRSYVGIYELRPGVTNTIELIDGRLTTQLTGQRAHPLVAETETKFLLQRVNAQIEFIHDVDGRVTDLVMYQNGRSRKIPRIADNVK